MYTNTRSFVSNFAKAAPRLRIHRQKHNGNLVDIGPCHRDLEANVYHNIDKASIRNTDIIFGKKDRDLQTEPGGPLKFAEVPKTGVDL